MLYLNAQTQYYFYNNITDMRKGVYGLCGIVNNAMHKNIMLGDVFVFLNKRHNKIKLLQWDNDGFAVYEKKLEKGTFEMPKTIENETSMQLNYIQLQHILQGIILKSVYQKVRYIHNA